MNFDPFQKGITSLVVGASALFSSLLPSSMPPQSTLPLDKPQLVMSSNIQDTSSFKLQALSQTTETVTAEELTPPEETVPVVLGASMKPAEVATVEAEVKVAGPELPAPTPSPKATPKPKKLVEETPSPSPKATPLRPTDSAGQDSSPTATPEPTAKPQANSLNPEIIFGLINNHRKDIGLAVFEKDDRLCKIAEQRVPELQNEIFGSGTMHAGLKAMNLPYWETENIASYNTEQVIYNWWMSDYIHKKAIESTDNKYSCGACLGNSCALEFSSFTPK